MFEASRDLGLSYDGDFLLYNGDFAIVSGLEWFKREINKIIRTNNPEWRTHPTAGASLELYRGMPNTREIAAEIKRSISDAISKQGLDNGSLDVRVVPVSIDKINIFITIGESTDTQEVLSFIYGFDGGIEVNAHDSLEVPLSKVGFEKHHKSTTNKYQARK